MHFTKVIGLIALIFVFIIACAGTEEQSGTKKFAEENKTSNLTESWNGTWKVDSSWTQGGGTWVLKQSGKSVISTNDSSYKINGEVEGDQLKGKIIDDTGNTVRLNLEISSAGQSFKGKMIYTWGNVQLQGLKQK